MSNDIGYQDGITAFKEWFIKYSRWIDAFNLWAVGPRTTPPPVAPKIPRRGPNYNVDDMSTWPWPDKFFDNTMRTLKDDHDAASVPPQPEPVPPTPTNPWDSGYAPQAYNQGSRGQNAKFNVRINCTLRPSGDYEDKRGITYQDNGLCRGGRTEPEIPELKPSDMSDGKEPWEAYEWMGNTIGPNAENYPAASYSV